MKRQLSFKNGGEEREKRYCQKGFFESSFTKNGIWFTNSLSLPTADTTNQPDIDLPYCSPDSSRESSWCSK